MPKDSRALNRAARERTRYTGETYTAARAALLTEHAEQGVAVPKRATVRVQGDGGGQLTLLLMPAPDADGLSGWRRTIPLLAPAGTDQVLADRLMAEARWVRTVEWPDAALTVGAQTTVRRTETVAAARAVREATYTPTDPDRPCRCSTLQLTGKPCHHGSVCADDDDVPAGERCQGRLVHVDRYPGSLWGLRMWEDVYVCADCEESFSTERELDGLPWGVAKKTGEITGTRSFDGVRHPMDDEAFWEGDEDEDYVDPGCPECGAGGPDSGPYEECSCWEEGRLTAAEVDQ
jgi:hypothetical protein